MNRDDIIRMAQEAGMREGDVGDWTSADAALTYPECVYTENLERFAKLVAATDREAIARLVEQMGIEGYGTLAIAVAIRQGERR